MLKLKSQLTCAYCSNILIDPILLPCEDLICRKHLSERDVVKENKIKCKECNEEFQVKDNAFKSIKALTKLIETRSYLNEEEIRLKQELEASVQKFFDFYDEFMQNKTQLQSDVFEHFQEMRFQIDEQREKFKEKIDDIAMKMIDEATKYEQLYLQDLKERFSSFDDSQSLDGKLNEIEETFRDPNLLIQTIKEMQQKQEASLGDIQFKLSEMTKIKDHLKATNYFKPSLSSFNQEETSVFGSIKLNQYSNTNSFKNSLILNGERQCSELIKLCQFSPTDKWSLLYRGTRDGFGSNVFHLKCDGHLNTLTILKAKGSKFVFGGFTTVSWESCPWPGKYKSDPNAFIFSLTNKDNRPVKMKVNQNRHQNAIYCHSECGPSFGTDIMIANNANTTMNSYSNLGHTYRHPQYEYWTNEARTFMAGSCQFQLDEIEVFQKE